MNSLDLSGFSEVGLMKMHLAVTNALKADDGIPQGQEKLYGVRAYQDWRDWSDCLEGELEKRGVLFEKVPW